MAVIIAADDSDGWYDHVMPPIVNQSNTPLDFLCGDKSDGPGARCGYGPRLPLLVISPYARENYVSHALTDQTSILRFIEDNWLGGERISDISFDRIAGLARRHVRLLRARHAPAPARSGDGDEGEREVRKRCVPPLRSSPAQGDPRVSRHHGETPYLLDRR